MRQEKNANSYKKPAVATDVSQMCLLPTDIELISGLGLLGIIYRHQVTVHGEESACTFH